MVEQRFGAGLMDDTRCGRWIYQKLMARSGRRVLPVPLHLFMEYPIGRHTENNYELAVGG